MAAAAPADALVSASGESEAPETAGGEWVSPTPAPIPAVSGSAPAPPGAEAPGPGPSSGVDKQCIFCKIGNAEERTDLLHWDEQFACFKDIRPGAPHHYLVVPRKHIGNCKSLKKEHISIVQAMVTIGKNVLLQKGIDDLTDVRLGFHWPPFSTVAHLHLHVLAPVSQMGIVSRMIYRANSYWFITHKKTQKNSNFLHLVGSNPINDTSFRNVDERTYLTQLTALMGICSQDLHICIPTKVEQLIEKLKSLPEDSSGS